MSQSWKAWWRRWLRNDQPCRGRRPRACPRLEILEDRALPSLSPGAIVFTASSVFTMGQNGSSEIGVIDPTTGQASILLSMPQSQGAISNGPLAVAANGDILYNAYGLDADGIDQTGLYQLDPSTGQVTQLPALPQLQYTEVDDYDDNGNPIYGPPVPFTPLPGALAVAPTGNIVFTASSVFTMGQNGSSEIGVIDPTTGQASILLSMPQSQGAISNGPLAVAANGDILYNAYGLDADGIDQTGLYQLDPSTGQVTQLPALPQLQYTEVDDYDDNGNPIYGPPVPFTPLPGALAVAPTGNIVFTASSVFTMGQNGSSEIGVIDPTTGQASILLSMPQSQGAISNGPLAVAANGDILYNAYGLDADGIDQTGLYQLDPSTGQVTQLPALPQLRYTEVDDYDDNGNPIYGPPVPFTPLPGALAVVPAAAIQIAFNALPAHTYGEAPVTLTATTSSGLPVSYTVLSGPATVAGDTLTITGAGAVTVEATQPGDQDNPAATPVDQSFTVNPAHLTVTADAKSRLYGQDNSSLTYTITGYVNGENAASAGITGTPSLSSAASATSPVSGSPYAITIDVSGMSASNYDFAGADGQLTVNPAHLTVTADDQSRLYGEDNPELTYAITGFVNGENAVSAGVAGMPFVSTVATPSSPVSGSSYAITVAVSGISASNYDFAGADGELTVNPAHLTVTADDQSRLYGEDNPDFTYTITGFVNDEDAASAGVAGTPTLTTDATPFSPVSGSPYAITVDVSGMSASNYDFAGADGKLTINPAHLIVTADDQGRLYGQANPPLTYTIAGFVNGENAASAGVAGTPVLTTDATPFSPVAGSPYTITVDVSGMSADNYDFAGADGRLFVAPAHLTVSADDKSRVYGEANPPLTFTIAGYVNGEDSVSAGVVGQPVLSTDATLTSPVAFNPYTITVDVNGMSAPNYDFAGVNGQLTINPDGTSVLLQSSVNPSAVGQQLTLTATVNAALPGSGTPGGSVIFLDGTTVLGSSSLQNGVATLPVTFQAVGTHTLTASYAGDPNFTGNVSANLPQQVLAGTKTTLTLSSKATVYGQPLTLTATVKPAPAVKNTKLTGSVTFLDGTTVLAIVPLKSGVATFTPSVANALDIGTHALTAVYGNDPLFGPSTSAVQTETVTAAKTHVALSAPVSAVFGQTVTLTAKVKSLAPSKAVPAGSVTFMDGTTPLGTVTLTNGSASLPIATLAVGKHTLTALFTSASLNEIGSTSAIVHTKLKPAATKTTLIVTVNLDGSLTLTAQVAVVTPGAAPLSALVTFKDGKTELGTAPVVDGVAQLPVSTLAHSKHKLTAICAATTDTLASLSKTVTETIN